MDEKEREEILRNMSEKERAEFERHLNEIKSKQSKQLQKILIIALIVAIIMIIMMVSSRNVRKTMVIIIPFIVVGGCLVWYIRKYISSMKMTQAVEATITEVEVYEYRDGNSQGKEYRTTYKYNVDGNEYIGFVTLAFGKQVGKKLKVYYNPNNPRENEAAKDRRRDIFLIILLVLVLIVTICITLRCGK